MKQFSRNEIIYAVQSGSPNIFNVLLNSVGVLVAEGFLFLLVIGTFAALSPVVALASLIYFGLIGVLIQHFIGRQMEKTSVKIAEAYVYSTSGLLDLGEIMREATTLGKKDFYINRVYEARVTSSKNVATQIVLQGAPRHIVETALIIGISGFIFSQSLSGDIASAAVVIGVFLTGGLRLTAALLPLQGAFLSIKTCIPAANRAFEFLDFPEQKRNPHTTPEVRALAEKPVSVEINNLCFGFAGEGSHVLSDISLKVAAGSQVAIIGPSGAGKSTLADLILGLLEPTSGKVRLNGEDPLDLLNNQPGLLGYVPQNPGMVSGTIAENIALGLPIKDIDQARLKKAIKDAHLTPLVESLSDGVNTNLGKQKDALSGGQLQRIGLARALYSQPRILVMDEATSALDADSESEINKALDEMRGSVTVILIAHRLNTVQRSDTVFLLEGGRVTDSGSFPKLLKTNTTVQRLAKLMSIDSAS